MSITNEERFDLIRILFQEQSKAILSAQEYKGLRSTLSRSDLKIIDKDYENIASYAAKYFLKKYPRLEDITDDHLRESLTAAIFACLGNKKK